MRDTTENPDPPEPCLHQIFEEQARRSPQAPAVTDARNTLTYGELDRQAEVLAGHLRGAGVSPDTVVGVYMEHCVEYLVACLATLKAGGAYLPLEMAYPEALLGEVIVDSDPCVILTKKPQAESLPNGRNVFCLDEGWENAVGDAPADGNLSRPTPEDLAFVAYSSGTTGKPKGIANPHRAAVRSYLWRFGISDYGPGDRVGCNVFFIWEMWRPLLRGATTCVIPDDVIYDPTALISFLEKTRITETLMTPSLLEAVLNAGGPELANRLPDLRILWLNGEVVTRTLARRAMDLLPETRFLNVYSISETHEVAAGDLRDLLDSPEATYCPVGSPMDPDHLYLLDEEMNLVPEGSAGELYIGGDGLARGYVNLPDTTAARFIENPFSSDSGRMYRTGDRGRLLPDGNLEILGRTDSMAKIRGYSVELGAVETAMENHLAVRNCVAVAHGEEGEDKRLVAYLVPGDEPGERYSGWSIEPKTGRSPDIRRRLQESLPHYMLPTVFVELDALPIQETTGKVDRKQLPEPPARLTQSVSREPGRKLSGDAPRHEKEALLARIWEETLGLEKDDVERGDDFFDLGGHSLAAAEMLERVEEAFDVRLPVSAFLDAPTVAELSEEIEARDQEAEEERPASPNLHSEAVLEPDIVPEDGNSDAATLRDAKSIFLTGATGFLGAFLVDELLSRTEAVVYCLVRIHKGRKDPMAQVRANLEAYGLWQPEHARRIVPVMGDLAEPLLGMTEEKFDELAREVDIVFHGGAVVNLIYPYSALKPANVDGTREVIRLACRHHPKPLHYVSSNGIFPADGRTYTETTDLDALTDARKDGYGQSKWVSEKLVQEAAGRGLPVVVYRPGNISGHSESGASNPRDFLGALIVESLRLGRAPRLEGWRMEMTPVDFVSRAIFHLAGEPDASGETFHLANPDPVPANNVFGWLEELGYPLEHLDYPEWVETLRKDPDGVADGGVGGVLRGVAPEARELWDGNTYDDVNTRRFLKKSGLRRPEIDTELVSSYARYFAERGWAPAPPRLSGSRRAGA